MPQHILKFKLPEEKEELETVLRAGDYYSVIHEVYQLLRNACKYGSFDEREATESELKVLEKVREKFFEILQDHDVEI